MNDEEPTIEDFGGLFDEAEISKARALAEHKYRDWSSDQIDGLRKRCKTDLFFLTSGVLDYPDLSPKFHGDITSWIRRQWGYQYRMLLLARGHYKSTLFTVADSIQMALPNVANVQETPYHYGPNNKILIAHAVREKAAAFLFEIAAAFTRKPAMLALFPECIPTKNVQRVNKWQLELPRDQHHREATFETIGAGGAAQGGHYYWLKLDDLVGEKERGSDKEMKTVLEWFDNISALLTDYHFDGFDLIGTRWAYHDVYSRAMETYGLDLEHSVTTCLDPKDIKRYGGGLMRIYARGAIENELPVFPEKFTMEKFNVLRKNKLIWASQFANNPMESGMNEFDWPLKFYNVDVTNPRKIVVFTGDSGEPTLTRYINQLDICVFVDPSMGDSDRADETGIVVTGVDHQNNIFLLETVKKRIDPTIIMNEFYRLNTKYQPRAIAIEEVNFSGIFKYWIEDRAEITGVHLPVRAYKPGSKRSKEARIRGLTHFFQAGQVYIHEGMHEFQDEYEQFPMGKSQHLLDALAQGPDFWQRGSGVSRADTEDIDRAADELLVQRDILTGY